MVIPSNEGGHLSLFNNLNCKIVVTDTVTGNNNIEPQSVFRKDYILAPNETDMISIDIDSTCKILTSNFTRKVLTINEEVSITKRILVITPLTSNKLFFY